MSGFPNKLVCGVVFINCHGQFDIPGLAGAYKRDQVIGTEFQALNIKLMDWMEIFMMTREERSQSQTMLTRPCGVS